MERTTEAQHRGGGARATSSTAEWTVDSCPPATHKVGSVVEDLLSGDVRDLQGEVAQLREALTNRATIDQAKGMLMARYGVDADTAFQILKRLSSVSNIQPRMVAEALVDIGVNGLPTPRISPGVEDGVLGNELRSFAPRRAAGRTE